MLDTTIPIMNLKRKGKGKEAKWKMVGYLTQAVHLINFMHMEFGVLFLKNNIGLQYQW